MAVFLALLLAVTMLPAAGIQPAFADEPNAATTDVASEGLLYKVSDGKATLVGFEDGASLEGDVVVPESVDGATVVAVEIADGQVAEGVTSLTLPQTVESVRTEGLASAFPSLASIEVDGTAGVYSTSGGMLFLQGKDAASSDGSTTLARHRELVWAPPALVVARLPIECKSIAPGAFVDAAALETVMCPGVMESIAVAEKDEEDNVVKPGAFTDEQIASLSIVVPGTNIASPSGDRVSASVALSEDEGMEAKREAWWKYGFNSDKIVMGTSFGEVEGVVAVSDDGTVEDASIDVIKPYEKKQLAEAAESGDAEAAARLAAPEGSGLSFSYNADMNLSVGWAGDKTATPATIEIPAYVTIDGVKYAVTEIAPEAFKDAVFLTSVTIPEGVRIIGESAFENCSNLKEVVLPSTLRTIDYATFKGCSALESVEIPDSVTWIGGEAFEGTIDSMNISKAERNFKGVDPVADGPEEAIEGKAVGFSEADDQGNLEVYATTPSDPSTEVVMRGQRSGTEVTMPGYRVLAPIDAGYVHMLKDNLSIGDTDDVTSLRVSSWTLNHVGLECAPEAWTKIMGITTDTHTIFTRFFCTARNSYDSRYLKLSPDDATDPDLRMLYQFGMHDGDSDTAGEATRRLVGVPAVTRIIEDKDIPYPTVAGGASPGKYYLDFSAAHLIHFAILYDETCSGVSGLRTEFNVEDANKHIVDPANNARSGYKFIGWTGPGNPDTPRLGSEFEIDIAGVAADEDGNYNLNYTAHWEPVSTAKFATGATATTQGDIRYYKGGAADADGNFQAGTVALPTAARTGFWFKGWYPTDATGGTEGLNDYWKAKHDAGEVLTGTMPADASGDVTFRAVWKPKTYTIKYDTSASTPTGGTGPAVSATVPSQDFAHPQAVYAVNNEISNASSFKFQDTEGASDADKRLNRASDGSCLDLSGVASSMAGDAGAYFELAALDRQLGAFPWKGWTKTSGVAIGSAPSGVGVGPWTTLVEDPSVKGNGYFDSVFPDGWSAVGEGDGEQEKLLRTATLYGVWGVTGEATIALAATQPSHTNNVNEQVVDVDSKGDASRGTESIRFRENLGFIGQDGVEALHTGTEQRVSAGHPVDSAMALVAPVRYGFEFIGWGEASGNSGLEATTTDAAVTAEAGKDATGKKIYIAYDEDAARGEGTGFTLTAAGAELVAADADAGTYEYTGADTWSAYWKIRTVDVALRIPLHAVDDVDFSGTSEGAPKVDANGKPGAAETMNERYGEGAYVWREGSAGETGNGASSGWYIASRTWNYGDLLEYPAFKTQQDRYTYDGWYHEQKSSITDSTDLALTKVSDTTKVATYQALSTPSSVYVTGGNTGADGAFATDAGIDVGDTYFTVGDPAAKGVKDGKAQVELWLWTSPIRINVAAPMGVYLCTTNSYGQAVDPYVVGNDRRTQLEAQAEFSVSTSSHDLQLVDVTAEDVAYGNIAHASDGTVANESEVVSAPVADLAESGICHKILDSTTTTTNTDNYTYDQDGSRMFWVSPVPTATADQTGVVYASAKSNAAAEAGKVEGEPALAANEGDLVPAVEKRRYFGFRAQGASGEGDAAATVGDDFADNVIHDDMKAGYDAADYAYGENGELPYYKLGDFILRSDYVAGSGLAQTSKTAGAATYRFYYGLDMRRAEFVLAGLQDLIDGSGDLAYNAAFDQPLLKVKFTFAAARTPGISYFSARMGETYDAAAEAGAAALDDSVQVTAGAPAAL